MATTQRQRNHIGKGDRLREELIAAAGRVLAASPDRSELSLRAVAREAGVAAPSVYLQFADKADLVAAVLRDHFDQLRIAILNAMTGIADPAARLRAGCLAYCRFGLDRPGPYRVLFEHKPADPLRVRPFGQGDDPGARAFATLVDAINDCMTAGIAPPGDLFQRAAAVWCGMHGYVTLVRAQPGFPWQPVEAQIEDLLVGLVGIPRCRPAPPIAADGHHPNDPAW